MKVRIFKSVLSEANRVASRLEVARAGTGSRFFGEFVEAGDTIAQNPRFFPRVEDPVLFGGEFREASLLNMTYRMIFEIRAAEVVVVSLIHTHRRPGAWHRSLGELDSEA